VLSRLDLDALSLSGAADMLRPAIRLAQRTGLARLAGTTAGGGMRLWAAVAGGGARRFRTTVEDGVEAAAGDALWQRVRGQLQAAPCRDGRTLRWRYGAGPDPPYRVVAVREGGALVGLAVVRVPREESDPRLKGLRVATLSDLLYPPDRSDIGFAAIAGAERVARDLEADALLCTASHRSLPPLLQRRAFLPVGGNLHFMIRDPSPDRLWPNDLADWWLTRGDSSADEVF
jgi:hypothetical protein